MTPPHPSRSVLPATSVRWAHAPLLLLAGLLTLGCARSPQGSQLATSLAFDPPRYPDAFAIARDELLASGFALDRVDARAGVISTLPKRTAGLMTPWNRESIGLGQAWQDLINDQARVVTVRFEPPPDRHIDRHTDRPPELMIVETTLLRLRYVGSRQETEFAGLGSRWSDPLAQSKGLDGVQPVPLRRDDAWSERLTDRIERRLERQATQAATGADDTTPQGPESSGGQNDQSSSDSL